MASGTNNPTDRALQVFTDMMISRIEKMTAGDWQKGWFNAVNCCGMPQNLSGRSYNGSNSFFLQLFSDDKGYKTPVFLTFNQVNAANALVLKGEKSFPVVYWDFSIKDKDGNKISMPEYQKLSREKQQEYTVRPFMKTYNVFNIDQTNYKEVHPEKYQDLLDRFAPKEVKDVNGMYVNKELDRMFEKQEWLCPIRCNKPSDRAFYSVSKDHIVLPMKGQFNKGGSSVDVYTNGMEFYGTALHEMAHSTLTPERLNRQAGGVFGDPKYAKEELVAELTSAMVGNSLGFKSSVIDNNAAYLSSWLSALKEEPKFIVSVMADVNKASTLLLGEINKQNIALGEDKVLNVDSPNSKQDDSMEKSTLIKAGQNDYRIRGFYDGNCLGVKKVDKAEYNMFWKLNPQERSVYMKNLTDSLFKTEISNLELNRRVSSSIKL